MSENRDTGSGGAGLAAGKVTLAGKDNYGKPKQAWVDKLASLDDDKLAATCEQAIWLSAYASNNPRSDYHWQADACCDHCRIIDKPEIYQTAWKRAAGQS